MTDGSNLTVASSGDPLTLVKAYTGDAAPVLKNAALFGSFLTGAVVLTQML
jgi:hypothetical protein